MRTVLQLAVVLGVLSRIVTPAVADPPVREVGDRLVGAYEKTVDRARGDGMEQVTPGAEDGARNAFVKVVQSEGQISLIASERSLKTGDEGALELALLEITGDEEALDKLEFGIDASSGAYIPSKNSSGAKGVQFWGTEVGFSILSDAMGRLTTAASDDEFSRGIAALSNSSLPESEPLEGVVVLELGNRIFLMFADSEGSVGVRYSGTVVWSGPDENDISSIQYLSGALNVAGSGFFEAARTGAAFFTARCCVTCGTDTCCCQGGQCILDSHGAACQDGSHSFLCTCTGANDCECNEVQIQAGK